MTRDGIVPIPPVDAGLLQAVELVERDEYPVKSYDPLSSAVPYAHFTPDCDELTTRANSPTGNSGHAEIENVTGVKVFAASVTVTLVVAVKMVVGFVSAFHKDAVNTVVTDEVDDT